MVKFVFFGSSQMSIYVLDELEKAGLVPTAVVTTPDKPVGRKQILTPTPVKEWAQKRNIKVYDPATLKNSNPDDAATIEALRTEGALVFIVASYGKLIPAEVISIPPHQTLNVHPSLLPKYRGASPLQSAMLDDAKDTGVTIMRIDEQMDHGPLVAQKYIHIDEWPTYGDFEELMAREGGRMLVELLPKWVAGEIPEVEQDHSQATYSRKFLKEDGEIDLAGDDYANFRKIQAFHISPGTYFFIVRNGQRLRVKVATATFSNNKLVIGRVIPEGSNEMSYEDFVRGYLKK